MIGEVIDNDEDFYFTIAYILLTMAILAQVLYYTFVIYSHQMIRREIIEKGRLLHVTPIISVATVCMPPNHVLSCSQTRSPPSVPVFTSLGNTRLQHKEIPPPYVP